MEAIELKNINKYYGKGTSKVHVWARQVPEKARF